MPGRTAGLCVLAIALAATTARAQVLNFVKDFSGETISGVPAIDRAGHVVYEVASSNQYGTNVAMRKQIFRWDPATGVGEQFTNFGEDVSSVSVSDDGQWLAFVSRGDLTGDNHDWSAELFVMRTDGTGLAQLTNDTSLAGEGVITADIAGSGNRVVFTADTDPLGDNPGRTPHVFVVDRGGANLVQLAEAASRWILAAISDDGARVAFVGPPVPPGDTGLIRTSPADGSSPPVTVTTPPTYVSELVLSGNGETIVFGDVSNLSVVSWNGTGLVSPLAAGSNASITDDGLTLFYNCVQGFSVCRVGSDGTGGSVLLDQGSSGVYYGSLHVSGDGSRIALVTEYGQVAGGNNPDGGPELIATDSSGGSVRQLTVLSIDPGNPTDARILPDGTRIFFRSYADLLGTNPDGGWEVYTMLRGGTGLAQVTNTTQYGVDSYSITDLGVVVFETAANLTGHNPCSYLQLYKINLGGTGLTQITNSCNVNTYTRFPVASYNGQWVLWLGTLDNVFGLYKTALAGTSTGLVTTSYDSEIFDYRMSATNPILWVAYDSPGNNDGLNPNHLHQIARISTLPSNYLRITADPVYGSSQPDISGDGNKIVWSSQADFVGLNPDHSQEIFLYDVTTGTTRQLTDTTGAGAAGPRITRDGAWVYYFTASDSLRLSLATGEVQRVTGPFRRDPPNYGGVYDVDSSGAHTLVSGAFGTGASGASFFLADQNLKPKFSIGKNAPTLLSWDLDPQSTRYDVIRGELANLAIVAGSVNLGPVACLEEDSSDNQTLGNEDTLQPNPGQVFFYLYRGTTGAAAVTGSWGQGTGGIERVAGAGSCSL